MSNKTFYMTDLEKLEVGEAPMPKVGPDDVMIKVQSVGVCGSDLHYYHTGSIGNFIVKPPFILGHEAAGIIEEVGENVKNLKPGDRVCMEPGVPCMKCEECLTGHYNLCKDVKFWATPPYDGVLSEHISHPAAFTFKIPDNMSFTEGALVEPLAIGLHACNTGNVKLGQTVVIVGAGCIGLVTLLAAKAYGATQIIVGDVLDKRLEKARELGAITVNTKDDDPVRRVLRRRGRLPERRQARRHGGHRGPRRGPRGRLQHQHDVRQGADRQVHIPLSQPLSHRHQCHRRRQDQCGRDRVPSLQVRRHHRRLRHLPQGHPQRGQGRHRVLIRNTTKRRLSCDRRRC